MALTVLSAWIALVAWRERRRWLLTWSGIYGAVAVFMTLLTYIKVAYIAFCLQQHSHHLPIKDSQAFCRD